MQDKATLVIRTACLAPGQGPLNIGINRALPSGWAVDFRQRSLRSLNCVACFCGVVCNFNFTFLLGAHLLYEAAIAPRLLSTFPTAAPALAVVAI